MKINNSDVLQIVQLDCCYADFFSGYHKPTFQIPIHVGMTVKEVFEEIELEYNVCHDLYYAEWSDIAFQQAFGFSLSQNWDKMNEVFFEYEEPEQMPEDAYNTAFFTIEKVGL